MNDDNGACRGAWVDECGGDERLFPGVDDHQGSWKDVEAVALEKCRERRSVWRDGGSCRRERCVVAACGWAPDFFRETCSCM